MYKPNPNDYSKWWETCYIKLAGNKDKPFIGWISGFLMDEGETDTEKYPSSILVRANKIGGGDPSIGKKISSTNLGTWQFHVEDVDLSYPELGYFNRENTSSGTQLPAIHQYALYAYRVNTPQEPHKWKKGLTQNHLGIFEPSSRVRKVLNITDQFLSPTNTASELLLNYGNYPSITDAYLMVQSGVRLSCAFHELYCFSASLLTDKVVLYRKSVAIGEMIDPFVVKVSEKAKYYRKILSKIGIEVIHDTAAS